MTEEQKKEAFLKAYTQKRRSIAEGILFNMFQGAAHGETVMGAEMAVRLADEIATEAMKVIYKVELTFTEDENTEEEA